MVADFSFMKVYLREKSESRPIASRSWSNIRMCPMVAMTLAPGRKEAIFLHFAGDSTITSMGPIQRAIKGSTFVPCPMRSHLRDFYTSK